ncbi:MAG TPA: aromatic hydrocarbon degradation protein [Marinobacter hydrocarbonoclasticus]|jgi:long-chain fatty acid transport protein|nr:MULTISPECIES: outer membrane protein transport protein [unclassified Marinobacter]MCS5562421.1 outer membrane protein transport protein [Marinobacter nauticus]MAC23944.1 aromatic hydrocarbon degradation protein [Marinobacter sp.]HAX08847.1 aromatic hydrocarbon degradation protein [Marinobacter nauticus]HCL38986.1 aromatic hydrocarbon degradation protein [Marinobacter nauticus]HCR46896.1 aromatic hydrocarbon degradation protein [Marinobacter nauticus]|tara:strand:+ start:5860 stop:7296 length:1437 start_codon:yes stop_codon:yes gene_type:complete
MNKNTNALVKAIRLVTLAAVAAPASVLAGGFSLNEQSASQMGVANAGAAANPENATTVLFNPAGMSQLSGTNISFGAAVLDIDAEAKSGAKAVNQLGGDVEGSRGGDIADPAVLPNFYLTHEINDSIDVGFGIHAPYGLAADYDNDFVGRYFADKTELTAIAFTPSIAINNGKGLSMGATLNIMYAEGRLSKFQDIRGGLVQRGLPPAQANGLATQYEQAFGAPYADIEGDDVAINFRVGFLYELSEQTQIGLTAQTGTEFELEGEIELEGYPAPSAQSPFGLAPQTLTENVTVPLAIPESATLGLRHRLTDNVTLLAGATYARWSRFEELDINSREGQSGEVSAEIGRVGDMPITHITEEWKNTWQFNVGGIWQATPEWALKAGYAFDESPVDQYVTARIPSEDRHWLTLGTQWKDVQSGWTVDVAVGTLIFADDAKVDDREYSHADPTGQPISNANYQAEYELSAWSAAFEVSKAF